MYDYRELIAEYLDAVESGTGIQQAAGRVMKELFEKGNVSLLARPQVSGMTMTHAGWDNISENDTATVYTMWYSGGTDGVPWVEDIVLHMTPIMSNGTVKTPEQLDAYVDSLLANNNSVDSLLEADKPSEGGFGLVICVQRSQEGWTKAHNEADIYDTALHQLQAAYYLNGTEDLSLGKDLMTIANWYATYKIYIKNYIGFDGTYTANEDLVYTVPISVNDEMNVFTEPKVTGDMGKAGTFEFGMQAGHPYYERLCQMKTIFRVVYDGDTVFRGRVLTIDTNHMNGNKQVHCEGDLAFLLDSQIEGIPDENRTKSDALPYMSSLIAAHNAQMNEDMPDKKFELGEVPGAYSALTKDDQKVHPDGDYRYGSGSWRDSQSAWNDLTGSFGGFIRTRYQNGTCYIDWLDQYFRSGVNPQTIEIRENLIDLSSNSEVDNIFTAVIPVGSNNGKNLYINGYNGWAYNRILVPDIVGFYSDAELNQGFHTKSDYQNAVNNYGIIYHTESFSNADTQAKLWEYALDWIKNNYIGSLYSFDVTALDMHLIGESSGKFLVGDKVNIIYPDSNRQDEDPEAVVQKTLTIMGATYSLHDPSRNTYKIGVPNAVLKRNYGEKQKKKTSRASSSLSSQLADEANKQAEEIWEDTEKTYTHSNVWGAILANPDRDAEIAQYGQALVDKVEAIAEQWLYDTVNGLDSQYGSLPSFLSSGFTTNADILALGENGRKLLRSRLVLAGNNNLPVWSKTKVTEFGQITEVMTAEYAYPAVVHSKNGGSVAIRKSKSASSSKVGDVPSNSTVWCRVKPESCKDTWIPVQFGDKIGYMQTKFVVQCTDKYDQGTGYPELTEIEKENKISFSQIFNSEDGKTLLSSLGVASPEELTKVVEEGKLPGVSIDGDGNLQLGDGLNYLINLMGGNSEINLGNGTDILARLFGMNGNDESSGFEFFKKLPGQLQQKILTIFADGKTGTQTLLKQFFGGNDFTGINDLLTGIGLPTVTISAEGTIELGTGTDNQPVTIKLDGNKNTGDGNKYGWIGIKKSNDGELSWVIQLNDVITYTDENNTSQTAYGFVSAADFHIPSIASFKTKLAVVDELVAGKITAADLTTFKATIDELYATKVEIDGMLTATTLFSGSQYTGSLNVTGDVKGGTVSAGGLNVGASGIKFVNEEEEGGGTTYKEHFVKIGSTYLETYILSNQDLEIDPADIIGSADAIVSIEKDTGLEDGKIGFKYTTISDSNANNHKVNFNIADTNYYKTRVGIKNATIESGDLEDYAGWDESVIFNGTDLKLESPYGLIEVYGNNTGESKNKYSIRIDASDILSEENVKATSYYQNDVGIEGCSLSSLSANDWTDHEDGHDSYNDNGTLTSKYGKVTVIAKDGTSFTFGINAEEVFNLGVIEGAGSADTESARISGYRDGYGIAHGEQRVWASAGEVQYGNCYYLKTNDKNQLDVYTTGTSILSYLPLQNGSLDPAAEASTRTGSTMETTISLPVKTTNGQLSKGNFENGKFVIKSVSEKKPSVSVDEEVIAADVDDLEIAIAASADVSGEFRWAQDIQSKKYYYYYDIAGSVTADGSTIIDLSKTNQYHSADAAIGHGKGLMGVKAASWKNNVVTFEVEESATKKQSLTIVSAPSYTYDAETHKYKLSSSAYYVGNNNTNIAITGSSPEAGTYVTDDTAYTDGKSAIGVKAASWKNNVVTFEVEESKTKKQSLTIVSAPSYTYDAETHKYKLSSSAYYVGNNDNNIAITGSSPEAGTYVTDDTAFTDGVTEGEKHAQTITVYGKITSIVQEREAYYSDNTSEYSVYARATGTGLDPENHPNSYFDQVLKFTPTAAIEAGMKKVHVTAASIVANLNTYDGDYSDIPVDVTLNNSDEPTRINVDMRPIYQDGLDGKPAITEKEFEFEFIDDTDAYVNVDDPDFTLDVSGIYQNGVRDAQAVEQKYRYAYTQQARSFYYKSLSGRLTTWGVLQINTEVELIDEWGSPTNSETSTDKYYKVKYGNYIGYILDYQLGDPHYTPQGDNGGWVGNAPSIKITSVAIKDLVHTAYNGTLNTLVCVKNSGSTSSSSGTGGSLEDLIHGAISTSSTATNIYYDSRKVSVNDYNKISTSNDIVFLKELSTNVYAKHSNLAYYGNLNHKITLTVTFETGIVNEVSYEINSAAVTPERKSVTITNLVHALSGDNGYFGDLPIKMGSQNETSYARSDYNSISVSSTETYNTYFSGDVTHSSGKTTKTISHKMSLFISYEFDYSKTVWIGFDSTAKAPSIAEVSVVEAKHSSGSDGYNGNITVGGSNWSVVSTYNNGYSSISTTAQYSAFSSYISGSVTYAYNASYPAQLNTKLFIRTSYDDGTSKTDIVEVTAKRQAKPDPKPVSEDLTDVGVVRLMYAKEAAVYSSITELYVKYYTIFNKSNSIKCYGETTATLNNSTYSLTGHNSADYLVPRYCTHKSSYYSGDMSIRARLKLTYSVKYDDGNTKTRTEFVNVQFTSPAA